MKMKTHLLDAGAWGRLCVAMAASLMLGACQMPFSLPSSSPPTSSDGTSTESGQSVPKELPTRESRAQAATYATDAMNLLQNGEEAAAKTAIERSLQLDPANEIARKLSHQIKADPQQELGSVFFYYSIRPEDTLSKLAQRYLNDRYRFYILARYNDIKVPNRLEVGQVIKIPGKEPPPLPPPVIQPTKAPEPPPRPAEPTVRPAEPPLGPTEPVSNLKAAEKAKIIRRLSREAEVCYQRDRDLDCAIEKWGQVLAINPDNQLVKLKRERAIALRQQLHRDSK
jgi:tetratricopeptide (TPR) repeat protein